MRSPTASSRSPGTITIAEAVAAEYAPSSALRIAFGQILRTIGNGRSDVREGEPGEGLAWELLENLSV
jgi:hypothetical protein